MELSVIFYGIVLFLSCIGLHIVIWRIQTPWISSAILLPIFILLPAVALAAVYASVAASGLVSMLKLGEIYFLHICLSVAYIASYPAVRAVSPSLDILLMIKSSDAGRMTEEDLKVGFARKRLLTARIDDLNAYKLLRINSEGYCLTAPAILISRLFSGYRRMLGLPPGGG